MSKNMPFTSEIGDFAEFDEDLLGDFTTTLIEATNHQAKLAFDLTKLIVEKNASAMDETAILATFARVNQFVAEHLPLKSIIEKIDPS